MKVRELMTTEVVAVSPTTSVGEVLQLMLRRHLNDVLVLDGHQKLLGIVTYSDMSRRFLLSYGELMEHAEYMGKPELMEDRIQDVAQLRVDQIMTKDVVTVTPDDELLKAGAKMTTHHIKQVPVLQESKLLGILSYTDIGWGIMMLYPDSIRTHDPKRRVA